MTRPVFPTLPALCALALAVAVSGCSSTMFAGERVDYRSTNVKMNPLEVPPDLTQLSANGRYQTPRGTVSASTLGATAVSTSTGQTVAPTVIGDYKVERDGQRRWLSVPKTPEQVWPLLVSFWTDMGFTLVRKDPASGTMETDWVENRAKLPQDMIRSTLGSVLGTLYSTGELDKYLTRVERGAGGGSEILVTHKGMEEVYTTPTKEATTWQARPNDPNLEAEILSRMLVKLGATEMVAKQAIENPVAGTPAAPAAERARVLTGRSGAALEVDDSLDKAWRRVGLALDRSGFTVEDRDRAAGLYFVRYVDPKTAGKEDTGSFLTRWFGKGGDTSGAALKYQVALKGEGSKTIVSVLSSQGTPESGENGSRIVSLLAQELK